MEIEMSDETPGRRADAGGDDLPGLPSWVKRLAIVVTVAVLVIVVIMLLASGEHGPGRHFG
ncbi:hypothetical protein JCM10369A_33950 [Nocardioides pyridinolyticus]